MKETKNEGGGLDESDIEKIRSLRKVDPVKAHKLQRRLVRIE